MSEILLQNIYKSYDPGLFKKKVHALRGLNLEVRQGEVFGLIGPNGAGKSTTIRLLLELARPDVGRILFRGTPLAQAQIQRHVGYLPENPYLYDHLTLHELLDFGGRVSGMNSLARKIQINKLVARLDIAEVLCRPMRTFSKGMRQRAAICYALLHDPSVVILDEPMSGLDPLGRRLFFDLIMDQKNQGKTIFFCSHILSDVERLCDRIGLLFKGRLIKEFDRSLFFENSELPVHLVLTPMSEEHKKILEFMSVEVTSEPGMSLVSLAPGQLVEVAKTIDSLGLKVLGTRTGKVSLEQLFLQSINDEGASG